jgi:hypothetical protein
MSAFSSKYPGASSVECEEEKEDDKLYYEAEFKLKEKKGSIFPPGWIFHKGRITISETNKAMRFE